MILASSGEEDFFVKKSRKAAFEPKTFLAKVGDGKTITEYQKDQVVFSQGAHLSITAKDREGCHRSGPIGPYAFRPGSKLLLNPKGSKVRLTEKESSILRAQTSCNSSSRDTGRWPAR